MASWNKGFLKAPKQKEEQPNLEFGDKKPHLESPPETQAKLKKNPKLTKVREVSEFGFQKEINANKLETMIEDMRNEVIQLKKENIKLRELLELQEFKMDQRIEVYERELQGI